MSEGPTWDGSLSGFGDTSSGLGGWYTPHGFPDKTGADAVIEYATGRLSAEVTRACRPAASAAMTAARLAI